MPNTSTHRKTKGRPDRIDVYVGSRMRERRAILGLSQEKLADVANVTFQQVQKYEKGTNRMSASRLYTFAKFLDVSINYFYVGMDGEEQPACENHEQIPENIMKDPKARKLLRAYCELRTDKSKAAIVDIVVAVAGQQA